MSPTGGRQVSNDHGVFRLVRAVARVVGCPGVFGIRGAPRRGVVEATVPARARTGTERWPPGDRAAPEGAWYPQLLVTGSPADPRATWVRRNADLSRLMIGCGHGERVERLNPPWWGPVWGCPGCGMVFLAVGPGFGGEKGVSTGDG